MTTAVGRLPGVVRRSHGILAERPSNVKRRPTTVWPIRVASRRRNWIVTKGYAGAAPAEGIVAKSIGLGAT
jgi:hypothetical protein